MASLTPYIASVNIFAGNFAPRQWAFCAGQLISISQNSALFSLLGTTFGGDGVTTFALPDLRGRTPVGVGNGAGISPIVWGQKSGVEHVTLTTLNLPPHNHDIATNNTSGRSAIAIPQNNFIAPNGDNSGNFEGTSDTQMNANSLSLAGSSSFVEILKPYLCMYFIIALYGVYPSRN
jgi:microcystin-dependent protein